MLITIKANPFLTVLTLSLRYVLSWALTGETHQILGAGKYKRGKNSYQDCSKKHLKVLNAAAQAILFLNWALKNLFFIFQSFKLDNQVHCNCFWAACKCIVIARPVFQYCLADESEHHSHLPSFRRSLNGKRSSREIGTLRKMAMWGRALLLIVIGGHTATSFPIFWKSVDNPEAHLPRLLPEFHWLYCNDPCFTPVLARTGLHSWAEVSS